jgi:anti-sigma factor RsiW
MKLPTLSGVKLSSDTCPRMMSVRILKSGGSGFALAGGRLDYLEGRNVAAITYRHCLHRVNFFVWPAPGAGDLAPQQASRNGFAIVCWTRGGFAFAAVADIAATDLAALADLVGVPHS